MPIQVTRRLLSAALDGTLNNAPMVSNPNFGFGVPTNLSGVDDAILQPRNSWKNGSDYDAQAKKLANMFVENFKIFEAFVDDDVIAAAPST